MAARPNHALHGEPGQAILSESGLELRSGAILEQRRRPGRVSFGSLDPQNCKWMRLWSLHPRYLDRLGLLALWREALLAQKVLQGRTRGYRFHPQLQRFRTHPNPAAAIACYLAGVLEEAERRGYRFDRSKVGTVREVPVLEVTTGQLRFEHEHLLKKLRVRDPVRAAEQERLELPRAHPLFRIIPGPIAAWERTRA